ncbi:TPA: hypothetical protein ACIYHT_004669 [Escherichia coli]|nr:hypothetical protein [Escherichia coli]MCY6707726.1 hypothetical protein [Escherichia coli]
MAVQSYKYECIPLVDILHALHGVDSCHALAAPEPFVVRSALPV